MREDITLDSVNDVGRAFPVGHRLLALRRAGHRL